MDLVDLARAEAFVRPQLENTPQVALVLGSGLGSLADAFDDARRLPYAGHPLETVVLGVRLMLRLGARTLIVSNAAGGLDPTLEPGSLLVIDDHLNLTGRNCLMGPNPSELGPRFPDMSEVYDRELI